MSNFLSKVIAARNLILWSNECFKTCISLGYVENVKIVHRPHVAEENLVVSVTTTESLTEPLQTECSEQLSSLRRTERNTVQGQLDNEFSFNINKWQARPIVTDPMVHADA